MVGGKNSKKDTGMKKSHPYAHSKEYAKPMKKVARDEIGRMGIVQEILRKSTDFLRRVIAPAGGMGGVTLSCICPHCNNFPLEDYIWCVLTGHGDNRNKKHCSWWCAVCGGRYEWRAPNRILVVQLGTDANEAKVFRAHTAPQWLCEHLINALKMLANQQTDGDSPIQSIVTGLQERSRQGIMGGAEKFHRN